MPAGRPIEPVPQDIADSLVSWIAEGKTLREFCRQPGMPVYSTIYNWEEKDAEFATRIARARLIGEQQIAEESLEIIDERPTFMSPNPDGGKTERVDPAGVQRNFRRAEHRLKLLAKWNPRKYGEKVDVNHGGELAIKRVIVDL